MRWPVAGDCPPVMREMYMGGISATSVSVNSSGRIFVQRSHLFLWMNFTLSG